jgi:hypothetical protein
MLTPHTQERCFRFWEIINEAQTKKEIERAVTGLKAWKSSNSYRLTESDKAAIDLYIHQAKKGINRTLNYSNRSF